MKFGLEGYAEKGQVTMSADKRLRAAAAEALVAQVLLRSGYEVFRPIVDGSPVDLIAIGHSQMVVAQVKIMQEPDASASITSYLRLRRNRNSDSYIDTIVNTIIGVSHDFQQVFLVPRTLFAEYEGKAFVSARTLLQHGIRPINACPSSD